MKLGYACLNRSLDCSAAKTFRLSNYTDQRLVETVTSNLSCLRQILEWNLNHQLLFFRISSDIIPFASHPVNQFDWLGVFASQLRSIGNFIRQHRMRISMHPDQFVLINSPSSDIVQKSLADLEWHCRLLDAMELDDTAKVQIHVGGVYGDKTVAMDRFVDQYLKLPNHIIRRLTIENDDRLYSLADCLHIHHRCGVPILFDFFHHHILNQSESVCKALSLASKTWKQTDGLLMVDYSSQEPDSRKGKHAAHIDLDDFKQFLSQTQATDCDIMLEIKDKEKSALELVTFIKANS